MGLSEPTQSKIASLQHTFPKLLLAMTTKGQSQKAAGLSPPRCWERYAPLRLILFVVILPVIVISTFVVAVIFRVFSGIRFLITIGVLIGI